MSILGGLKGKLGRVKGAEWAMLLIVLGIAGSLLLPSGMELLGGSGAKQGVQEEASGALEERLARVLSRMDGAGTVEVVIHYAQPAVQTGGWLDTGTQTQTDGEVLGVVVVAAGAGDLRVRLELARAVQTLLRLDADAVEIFKMDAGEQEV